MRHEVRTQGLMNLATMDDGIAAFERYREAF
jgi:hypothetical protein